MPCSLSRIWPEEKTRKHAESLPVHILQTRCLELDTHNTAIATHNSSEIAERMLKRRRLMLWHEIVTDRAVHRTFLFVGKTSRQVLLLLPFRILLYSSRPTASTASSVGPARSISLLTPCTTPSVTAASGSCHRTGAQKRGVPPGARHSAIIADIEVATRGQTFEEGEFTRGAACQNTASALTRALWPKLLPHYSCRLTQLLTRQEDGAIHLPVRVIVCSRKQINGQQHPILCIQSGLQHEVFI